MRPDNPEATKDFWLAQFLRLVLTRRPALRWHLDYTRIDQLYATRPDAIQAAQDYLKE